ncbi:Glucans biosynthesis protein D [Halomonadaceae bacterium LMG 33818]|uniref:glucan biosynthesis protein n=1 Tax=Cernens ardua TaxID=3402176 RepID=UPI003EDC84E1
MDRRSLLKASLAVATYCGVPSLAGYTNSAVAAESSIADGKPLSFSFDILKQHAQQLSSEDYGGAPSPLPATLANLDPLSYQKIQYDPDHSLWHNLRNRTLDVQFFHVGMGFKRRVRMFSLDPATHKSREIHFRPDLFAYKGTGVDVSQISHDQQLGFAGFRVFEKPQLDSHDFLSFLGASYFRADGGDGQYGLSARGLAIDTFYQNKAEEFPDFVAFWIETPEPSSATTFTVYALLDSPSATGAYRFVMHCDNGKVRMDIDANIYAREDIGQLGVAPMTSMFSCGTNDRRACMTFHPQIHDSDRLSMWRGNGEWICRPLDNPEHIQFNAFADENPKGFGLLQLDRDFASYQDTVDGYNRRPSLWVEPRSEWGKGSIDLMELPTTGETLDNIVCFWNPAEAIKKGSAHHFAYRLYWSPTPPFKSPLANVYATRDGIGGFTEGWAPGEHWPTTWARRFAVDFVGDTLNLPEGQGIDPQISVSSGEAKSIQVLQIPEIKGYRVLFDWYPNNASTDPVNMRLYLKSSAGNTLSETWLYQYFPPAPADRRYPDWPAGKHD